MTARIIKAYITAMPHFPRAPRQRVFVTLDDGTAVQFLFDYHPEEVSFTPEEFVGLTIDEAHALKRQKDCAYHRR